VAELARQFTPTLRPAEVRCATATALAKAQAGSPYRFSNLRLIELLDIQPEEQRHLCTLVDPDERRRRKEEAGRQRHGKQSDRAAYEANAAAKRLMAHTLRAAGLSNPQIADSMGIPLRSVKELLRTPPSPVATPPHTAGGLRTSENR